MKIEKELPKGCQPPTEEQTQKTDSFLGSNWLDTTTNMSEAKYSKKFPKMEFINDEETNYDFYGSLYDTKNLS